MRSCGACRHAHKHQSAQHAHKHQSAQHAHKHQSPEATAACVLVFSRNNMHGADGILEHVAALANTKIVPKASAYCKVCRANTWLCMQEDDVCAAVLDFWKQWHSGKRIVTSMQVMQRLVETKRKKRTLATAK